MTLNDGPRFTQAMERMHRLHGLPAPTADDIRDWMSELQEFPIAVVEHGLDAARAEAKQWRPKAAVAREACQARTVAERANHGDAKPTRYVPLYTDNDGRTLYQAEYRCAVCEDGGWQPVEYDATGQHRVGPMTMGALREREKAGRVPTRMRRCPCRTGGVA
jgi:hypothetical protein